MVNISLLSKWRWKLLDENYAVLKEVIKSKYGVNVVGRVELGKEHKPWYSSLWWRDICSIGLNLQTNWFACNVFKKLGNGVNTSFWCDKWIGESTLKDRFPRLFSISSQKLASVADLWSSRAEEDRWQFLWRRRFFEWERQLFVELREVINQATVVDSEDKWCWKPDVTAGFSVKSAYSLVSSLSDFSSLDSQWHAKIFNSIWKCPAP
jgi:hypothetical protein